MRGKTAKLIRKYAARTGQYSERRGLRRAWNSLTSDQRVDMGNRLKRTLKTLDARDSLRESNQRLHFIRRMELDSDSKVLWFESEKFPGEATVLLRRYEGILAFKTHPGVEVPVPETKNAFEKMWDVAVAVDIPDDHLAALRMRIIELDASKEKASAAPLEI